jgi:ABC-type maltose transport system permease subunit
MGYPLIKTDAMSKGESKRARFKVRFENIEFLLFMTTFPICWLVLVAVYMISIIDDYCLVAGFFQLQIDKKLNSDH